VSGELECTAENETGFWGCPSRGFGLFFLSSLDYANNSNYWIFPGNILKNQPITNKKKKNIQRY
jgi:hypothetical protein